MHMSDLKSKVFSQNIHLNQLLASPAINSQGTSDFVRITYIFGNIFSDFLCFINAHGFANSITCISNIRHECKIAMSLHYFCTNNSILEHVVACDMSNL